ncbi:unnamed protein product [Cyprideis torosa]|uniref:Uncharacterized protein n=1 Tax=Cyprideis torosa TaxID=163714 RepID=A0A7R8WA47_9CRUS|nr:unnamed protein product [Cyprideis torosa]CAG0890611.1 unnamed protein product [Cyprideis torosa]
MDANRGGYDGYGGVGEMGGGGGYGGIGDEGGQYFHQQPAGVVRPRVDPDATGQVDPTMYPEAKDSTKKVRGKSDIMEMLCSTVSQELLMAKTFYFFFFSAFGSLFPLMAVYFKQLGMSPGQCGILSGIRPLVEFVAVPFWVNLSDKYQKGKTFLMLSLSSWIIFTLSLGFIQTGPTGCLQVIDNNDTHALIVNIKQTIGGGDRVVPFAPATSPFNMKSSITDSTGEKFTLLSPINSNMVYDVDDVSKVFFLLFLLVVLGEGLSAPAITFADSAVLSYLGEDADQYYGWQRMFGSLGWGLAMFFLGIALDHATAFPDHPCEPNKRERNYTICFAVFSVLMGCALISATQFGFTYKLSHEQQMRLDNLDNEKPAPPVQTEYKFALEGNPVPDPVMEPALPEPPKAEDVGKVGHNGKGGLQWEGWATMGRVGHNGGGGPQWGRWATMGRVVHNGGGGLQWEGWATMGKVGYNGEGGPEWEGWATSRVFAMQNREMPEWMKVFRHFNNVRCITFLFVAWLMGFGIGLIFTFLFWYLQDFGGTPTLFGVASVINHISEIFAYFFSFRLITQLGHVKVLCLGLLGNVLRFLYVSWLRNPWWVLPFEFIQGITHAGVWAACNSYLAHVTPLELRPSATGVLQGLHHGLGRACGSIFGGFLASSFGITSVFRGYGVACFLALIFFVFINFYRDGKFQLDLPTHEDPREVAEATHLAPHGVPANPMPRVLSSSRLQERPPDPSMYDASMGLESNVNNPFLDPSSGQRYGGGGMTNYGVLEEICPLRSGAGIVTEGEEFNINNPFFHDLIKQGVLGLDLDKNKPSYASSKNYPPVKDEETPEIMVDLDWIRKNFQDYSNIMESEGLSMKNSPSSLQDAVNNRLGVE